MKTAPPRHTIVPGCFCLLASILAFPRPVAALGGHWLSGGPWGGEVYALAGDPQDPSILLAGTYSGGLYRSTDGAASWAKVDGIPDDGFYQYVDDVAFDPVDQTRVYAAVNDCCSEPSGVYRSFDGGASWSPANNGISHRDAYSIAVDPVDPSVVYAGVFDGIYKSTDGGDSWSGLDTPLINSAAEVLRIDPQTRKIYAGVQGNTDGVLVSDDQGATWAFSNNGLNYTSIGGLVMDPLDPRVLYAGTQGGVFKTTDGALTWTEMSQGLTNKYVFSLAIDPTSPSTVFAGTYGGGVFRSTDGAAHWSPASSGLLNMSVSELLVGSDGADVYAGTLGTGIFKSTDDGDTWSQSSTGFRGVVVRDVAVSPADPSLVAAAAQGDIFRSEDRGRTWEPIGGDLTGEWFDEIEIDPVDTSRMYVWDTIGPAYRTADGGQSWTLMIGPTSYWGPFAIEVQNPDIVFAGGFDFNLVGKVQRSMDAGVTWRVVYTAPHGCCTQEIVVDPSTEGTAYAAIGGLGVVKTTDEGVTWTVMSSGLTNTDVTDLAISTDGASIYLATEGGLFKSVDGASSWSQVLSGDIGTVAVHPTDGSRVYAAIADDGVYASKDGGSTWQSIQGDLADRDVESLALDPLSGKRLYAGTEGSAVFVRRR